MPSLLQTWALPLALFAITNIAATWYNLVSKHVQEPYLDEVFHVPQAQRYCKSDWSWDPKITTPPGLYLVSLLLEHILGCETYSLRALNAGAICLICLTSYQILRQLRSNTSSSQIGKGHSQDEPESPSDSDRNLLLDAHSALNISLFPPLFFFAGLYYTDVLSTLVVLLSYSTFISKVRGGLKARDEIRAFILGIMALSFRQTNIFWVAIFPAGVAVIDKLKSSSASASDTASKSFTEALARSWTEGLVYDVSVQDATLQDYMLIPLSLGLAAIRAPLILLKVVIPYVTLLGIFGGFVAWNGGVVLGDKSNHVATVHLPQMLYFWPYIVFFSLPLVMPLVLAPVVRRLPESRLKSFCEENLVGNEKSAAPRLSSVANFIVLGLTTVHFNTIVHPFTRADNRHYVFYVFRILLRHWAVKYAAVPLYYFCAWIVIQTLGPRSQNQTEVKRHNSPPQTTRPVGQQSCQASFFLVWLVTTALSVISAPLVEPRYFIIPWIIWRLHVPTISASPPVKSQRSSGNRSYDVRLVLETFWHLAITTITGYMFLFRGFSWPSEPGKVQRFMY